MLDEQMIGRALFGGTVEMSLPQRFVDVSDYRPVPDHQEVSFIQCLRRSKHKPLQVRCVH